MRDLTLVLLFVASCHSIFGQEIRDSLILTKEKNEIWISNIERGSIDEQLSLIKQRILLDTNVYVRTSAPDRIRIGDESNGGKKVESFGRPVIAFNGKCGHLTFYASNRTDFDSIIKLSEFLTAKDVKSVKTLKGIDATAIYGSRAVAGVFIIALKNKTICKQLKKIDFGQL